MENENRNVAGNESLKSTCYIEFPETKQDDQIIASSNTNAICELCFVQHGKQITPQYECILVLGKNVKLCKSCFNKNKIIIDEYKEIGTDNWKTMVVVSSNGVVL